VVPGYEIIKELGRGSMGLVYKARQISLDRVVALKLIRRGIDATDQALDRFVEEARLVASLQHPNIIQVYEISLHEEMPFFAMELAEGGSLADQIGGRPQPSRQAAQLVETLARAIHAAHQRGIVHRDLKPANILLATVESQDSHLSAYAAGLGCLNTEARAWTPKITDFGLAKQLNEGVGRTESGMILGTPGYMAPEQAEGKSREVGPAADVYALGAILYEMLTGRPPYAGESPMETVLQLFQMEPVAPSQLQPKVPRDLETICLKCLQKEPQKRYPNGGALAEDLRHFLAGEPILARPTSLPERLWRWGRRRPVRATLALCSCLACLAMLGLAGWHQVDLRSRLDQARLDERQARDSQEEARLRARLMAQRDSVKDLLRVGQGAYERKDWHNARVQLLQARVQAADEPELADLRGQIDRLLEHVEGHRRDRERLQKFLERRNDALFYATLYTGGDLVSTLSETRNAAQEALALFGATLDRD
jgi:serine/threonine protein kinase